MVSQMSVKSQEHGSAPISAVRTELFMWSVDKPRAVQNAVKNLDGWLEAAEYGTRIDGINVLACTARAVETLRSAVDDSPQGR